MPDTTVRVPFQIIMLITVIKLVVMIIVNKINTMIIITTIVFDFIMIVVTTAYIIKIVILILITVNTMTIIVIATIFSAQSLPMYLPHCTMLKTTTTLCCFRETPPSVYIPTT